MEMAMADGSTEQYHDILRYDLYAFTHRSFLELNPRTKFLPHPYIETLTGYLERVRRGEIRRLIINMPPRSLKSHCASIVFPAWLLGHSPAAQILAVSYAQDLSDRLARECRTLMSAPFYQAVFPTRLSAQKQATAEFETTNKSYRLSTSVGGVLTGRGADFLIIDDPLKPEEAVSDVRRKAVNEWYDNTLYTRLNSKASGAIVIIMQRLHEDDLVGHVTVQEPWVVLSFPAVAERDEEFKVETAYGSCTFRRKLGDALHPEHESIETLARIRQTIGPYNFSGQYQQAPAPFGGGMIKAEWFRTYDQLPDKFDSVVQSWDTASVAAELNSFTACTTWGVKDKHLYLLHVLRERLDYPNLKRAVRSQAQIFGAQVILIENKASGIQLIQELVAEGLRGITKYEPNSGDKTMRMHAQTAFIENGFVHLPAQAHWLGDYLHELVTFPRGTYGDQVDSTSQALHWIQQGQDCAGWIEFYRLEAERAHGRPTGATGHSVAALTMRAPTPYANYYMSGTNGRAGRYTSNSDAIIENVHPEDVERLLQQGCTHA
jgi:predicted phage terminase large subunit-like protein